MFLLKKSGFIFCLETLLKQIGSKILALTSNENTENTELFDHLQLVLENRLSKKVMILEGDGSSCKKNYKRDLLKKTFVL